jgi:4-hydroxy-2-oxoheptanedioate aldolase
VAPRANRFGHVANYHKRAHEQMCVLVQVETRTALAQIEAIAAVDGVDGIFIGPSDLAADMGHLADARHTEVQDAIAGACTRIRRAGKAAGMLTGDLEAAAEYLAMGFTFVAVGSDVGVLSQGAQKLAAHFKQIVGSPSVRP